MEPLEAIGALQRIIDASVSDPTKRAVLKAEMVRAYDERRQVIAKSILADCQQYGDQEVTPEIGELIQEVCFYYV